MINESQKERIKTFLKSQEYICTGNVMSDDEFNEYMRQEYTPIKIVSQGDDFFTYKETDIYIWIQDFIADSKRNAYKLLDKIKKMSCNKKIKCQVAMSNIRILNIIIRKGFRIKGINGYNYLLER